MDSSPQVMSDMKQTTLAELQNLSRKIHSARLMDTTQSSLPATMP